MVKLGFFFIGCILIGCAGKKTVNDSWDSSPRACDAVGTDACTALPQELSSDFFVDAGIKLSPNLDQIQYYRLIRRDAKFDVLFIHGALGHASDFRRQFSRAVGGSNLLAFDRPGFGRSTNHDEGATLDYQVKSAKTFLKDDSRLPLILVGHSYGGAIALQLALNHPQKVKGLILVSAILDPSLAGAFKVQSLLESSGVLSGALKQTNRELIQLQEGLEKLVPRIASLQIPIEAVHGGKDDVVGVANTTYLKQKLAGAGKPQLLNVEICSECGHRIPDQNPERLNAAIERIKRRLESN